MDEKQECICLTDQTEEINKQFNDQFPPEELDSILDELLNESIQDVRSLKNCSCGSHVGLGMSPTLTKYNAKPESYFKKECPAKIHLTQPPVEKKPIDIVTIALTYNVMRIMFDLPSLQYSKDSVKDNNDNDKLSKLTIIDNKDNDNDNK